MATPGMNYDYLLKYIIIGDAAVGKSNLLLRFSQNDFKAEYQLTIGVEFGAKNIDISNKKGRRNLVLLTLLYDSAIRVSELVNIRVMDLRLNDEPSVTILGKGNKYRKIPIMNKTKEMLLNYINENHLELSSYLFTNYGKNKLSIRMVQLIINKYNITNKKISPHSFRRSRAVHMLEADINIVYIRDILGHVSVTTTERYAMVSLELKKRALEKTNNNTISLEKQTSWNTDPDLLNELLSL